jgi:hypothetical protein
VFGQYPLAERIYLDLPFADHPCSLETEIKAADAGEQGTECHLFR